MPHLGKTATPYVSFMLLSHTLSSAWVSVLPRVVVSRRAGAVFTDRTTRLFSVGGGGLLSGIGAWVRTHSPNTRIIAVEPEGAATLAASLAAGAPTALNAIDGFADGVAVKMIGDNTFKIAQAIDPETVLVSNDEICASVRDIFEQTRTVVEPAGALALAGLRKHAREGKLAKGCAALSSCPPVEPDHKSAAAMREHILLSPPRPRPGWTPCPRRRPPPHSSYSGKTCKRPSRSSPQHRLGGARACDRRTSRAP